MSNISNAISGLSERYCEIMAGADIRQAVRVHAARAGIVVTYMNWDEIPQMCVLNVIAAASGQGKLREFIGIVKADGYDLHNGRDLVASSTTPMPSVNYKEWLKSETEYIDIRGIGERKVDDPIVFPLLRLYTELYVETGLTNLDLEHGHVVGKRGLPLLEMMKATERLVVMGDPGAGKTTFLRYVARKHVDDEDFLPIYIHLEDLREFIPNGRTPYQINHILEYLADLGQREHFTLDLSSVKERCENGRCLFLLDSLDELPSMEERVKMIKLIERATKSWSKCKFVLTSRPLALHGKAIPFGFEVVGIANWRKEEIQTFLQTWTSLIFPDMAEDARKQHWGGLLSTILERPDLQALAKNAVMVTAMAVVHYNENRLPHGRVDLLEALISWLLRHRTNPPEECRFSPKFVEERYREIALAMYESSDGRKNRVGRLWAAENIAHSFGNKIDDALDFLDHEESQTGVIVKRGFGDVAFWHASFQEFLAAKEIAGKTDDEKTGWWAKVCTRLDSDDWREVLVLVPTCLYRLGRDRVDLFFQRLGESCAAENLKTKAKRIALGGGVLKDLHTMGYDTVNAPSWTHALSEVQPLLFGGDSPKVALKTRYEAALAYGLGRDERLQNWEDTWVSLPGGTFFMGAQSINDAEKNYDKDAALWEGPVIEVKVQEYSIRKYLITVEEYGRFVENGGYEERCQGLWHTAALEWRKIENINKPLDWDDQLLMPNCPVTGISWYEANAYCNWLHKCDSRPLIYRLPTEAEWE